MANMVRQVMSSANFCTTAEAIATPSNVEVPRPNSSKITKEFELASCKMVEVSESSTKKVDWPSKMLSDAPMRLRKKRESTTEHNRV